MILILILCFLASRVQSISVDIDNVASICSAAATVLNGEWNYYEGFRYGGTVGFFQPPYYWWHAGTAFGGILDHWYYCAQDNETLQSIIFDAMYHQAGANFDFVPENQTMVEGNDDQGVWGLVVMAAIERNFTNPSDHSWIEIGQNVFNTMYSRWDAADCGGGLRWQIYYWNNGYDYKNTISNGCLFQIAARLAKFTGNDTYLEAAERLWDWMYDVQFVEQSQADGDWLDVWDGADIEDNCTDIIKVKWSYTYGIVMTGAAYMYNYTGDTKWQDRAQYILRASSFFIDYGIVYEHTCTAQVCNNDQRSFKSLFCRSLGLTALFAPETEETIMGYLNTSAPAAAQSCSGGSDGVTCGSHWNEIGWDGVYGLGEQMNALEVIQALLVNRNEPPFTADDIFPDEFFLDS